MKIPSEYSMLLPLQRGAKSKDVHLIQEWLSLNGVQLRADGDFGPATEASVMKFQTKVKLQPTGIVDEYTLRALIAPLNRACKPLTTTAETFSQRVVAAARNHLREHPREIGGQNKGPWVRLYTHGKEGPDYPWCAAFVTFLMAQAAESMKHPAMPIKGSLSCDTLVSQAKAAGRFVTEDELRSGERSRTELVPGTIFLVRNKKNDNDWLHTGIVTGVMNDYFESIEGNTNDDGDREGYEVCRRLRGYGNMDFILLG
jgi:hypothetical protein